MRIYMISFLDSVIISQNDSFFSFSFTSLFFFFFCLQELRSILHISKFSSSQTTDMSK